MYNLDLPRKMWLIGLLTFVCAVCASNGMYLVSAAPKPIYSDKFGNCLVPDALEDEIKQYQPIVDRIVEEIVFGKYAGDTWLSLSTFVEKFGPRQAGSQALEKSIDYMVDELKARGLENVHTENAPVSHWERGYEMAELLEPYQQHLPILGLGSSVGTPRGGMIAEVIAVKSFAEFDQLDPHAVNGKVVLFNPDWQGYGKTVAYRQRGASVAAKKGAVAALVRSVTPVSIGSPHTGMQDYEDGVKHIPVASVTVEDANKLTTMYRRGTPIKIRLEMEDRNYPEPVVSRNTISELQGSVQTNESVVVLAGHLDSWDVGNGAMDDGGGAFISWKAIEILKKLNLRPKRTIRSILWTAEETGYEGAKQYRIDHAANEKAEFNFFMESDMGTFEPYGMGITGNADTRCIFGEVLKLMAPLNATTLDATADGLSDVELWTDRGYPGAGLLNRNEKYFWYHHTAGDSMLVESPANLDKCTALFAAVSYVVADLSVDMPRSLSDDN